jgi:nucleoside-diphosphate-sugar epimerase
MQSDLQEPANIGNPEYISVNQLVDIAAKVAGKEIKVRHIEGPVGVESRNFSNSKIYTTGWTARFNTETGISQTYPWIAEQVKKSKDLRR